MSRRILLVGHLDYASGRELVEYCRRQRHLGATALTLDLTGVVSCDEAGINALATLREGAADLHVELSEPAERIQILHLSS